MGSFETAGQDLLLVEKAEALRREHNDQRGRAIFDRRLALLSLGSRRTRKNLGRETSSPVAAASASFYCLPAAVRQRAIAIGAAHGPATQASE